MMDDSVAAYTHGLRWALTDKKAHAKKAIEILNAYSLTVHTPWATLMFAQLPAFPKGHDPEKEVNSP